VTSSPDKQSSEEDVVIARIVKARGIKGEVACAIETDFPARFSTLEQVTILMPNDARLNLRLEDAWFHNQRVILKFEGYDTMTEAERLVGGRLVIAESDVEPLAEGQYLEREVVGTEVVTAEGRKVGVVTKVMRTSGTDVLVLEGVDGREQLIPFADEICTDVDLAAKRITIDPPDGLLDL
jgi:16S rRNA processing protein RimM